MANPPALTVRRNFPRPLCRACRAVARGAHRLDRRCQRTARGARLSAFVPITRAMRFCGVALTVHSRPRDNLAPYAAIQFAQPGDVHGRCHRSYEEASVAGDILLGMAKNKGIGALVTDGMVRDVDGLERGRHSGVRARPVAQFAVQGRAGQDRPARFTSAG